MSHFTFSSNGIIDFNALFSPKFVIIVMGLAYLVIIIFQRMIDILINSMLGIFFK
jgi:hypothetical protein